MILNILLLRAQKAVGNMLLETGGKGILAIVIDIKISEIMHTHMWKKDLVSDEFGYLSEDF